MFTFKKIINLVVKKKSQNPYNLYRIKLEKKFIIF